MNEEFRKIYEVLAAINARLEMNERLTQQIDNQLALLNIKREAELAELRTSLGISTRESDLLTIRMTLQNLSVEIGKLNEKLDAQISGAEKSSRIEGLLQDLTAAVEKISAKNDTSTLTKILEVLKISAQKSVKADDLLTIKMALQNSSIAINDVKKRVDSLKFDTTKKFNELSINGEINHKALMAAIEKLSEPPKTQAEIDAENFKVSSWWRGDKES